MQTNKSKLVVALALVGLAGFLVWRQAANSKINFKPSAAVGEVLADEASRLLEGNGQVVLIARAPDPNEPDANSERVAAFQAALKHRKSPRLAAVEWLARPPRGQMDMGGVAEEQLVELADKHPTANAFVIFAGLPPLSARGIEKITGRSLKLMAVCGYGANLKRLLQAQVVSVAVVPRFDDLPPGTPAPKTARDWFEREFELLTPETLARAPY
jgi:hypothetical protein